MNDLTPREIVAELDKYIIGQDDAKRAVAVAVRNRWRRQQLEPDFAREVSPKNIIMIGPTGVGKTEIARRLANLTGAPFVKVEASKYTEVGYHGRDVESMIRDLLEVAINTVRGEQAEQVKERALKEVEDRLVAILMGDVKDVERSRKRAGAGERGGDPNISVGFDDRSGTLSIARTIEVQRTEDGGLEIVQRDDEEEDGDDNGAPAAEAGEQSDTPVDSPDPDVAHRIRERMRQKLREGMFDDKEIEISLHEKATAPIMGMMGPDQMDPGMSNLLESLVPSRTRRRKVTVARARALLLEEETEKLIDNEKLIEAAIERMEQTGIVFLDEIDKIAAGDGGKGSPDVSRQGVQRDLLPIVEGSTVNTRHGVVRTDGVLFIAAGAFHVSSVSDLMPELQGRFPIRVELNPLGRDDFVRILTEPHASLTAQQTALLETEGLTVTFESSAIEAIADFAAEANDRMENIGARRLMTIVEQVFEDISFNAPQLASDRKTRTVTVDGDFVRERLKAVLADEDLSRFVL